MYAVGRVTFEVRTACRDSALHPSVIAGSKFRRNCLERINFETIISSIVGALQPFSPESPYSLSRILLLLLMLDAILDNRCELHFSSGVSAERLPKHPNFWDIDPRSHSEERFLMEISLTCHEAL